MSDINQESKRRQIQDIPIYKTRMKTFRNYKPLDSPTDP